ncbi:hypothetical protein [Arthrobacter glacialis]|uniref:hypothetical protein n=1 Tax=Arthrobacter glacialis TaxID=1664 RepID=UPI0013FE43B4|nr:hypothetical protein [Arthrobacter glacialis]
MNTTPFSTVLVTSTTGSNQRRSEQDQPQLDATTGSAPPESERWSSVVADGS